VAGPDEIVKVEGRHSLVFELRCPVGRDRFSPGCAHTLAVAFQDRLFIVEIEQRAEVSSSASIKPVYDSGNRIEVVP